MTGLRFICNVATPVSSLIDVVTRSEAEALVDWVDSRRLPLLFRRNLARRRDREATLLHLNKDMVRDGTNSSSSKRRNSSKDRERQGKARDALPPSFNDAGRWILSKERFAFVPHHVTA